MTQEGLHVEGVSATLDGKTILNEISFDVRPGEMVGVLGPNGAGKSSLLHVLASLLSPEGGQVRLDGVDLQSLSVRQRGRLVALVPQQPAVAFGFPCHEVVLMGRYPHLGWLEQESATDQAITRESMAMTECAHLSDRPITQVSGGERRRVFLARALAQRPRLLLLDEPTADQDLRHQVLLLERLRSWVGQKAFGVAAFHDVNLAARFSGRLLLLSQGEAVCFGTPAEVLTPANIESVYGVSVSIVGGPPPQPHAIVPLLPRVDRQMEKPS